MAMTRNQQIELCKAVNSSDFDAFMYLKDFCNLEQEELLERCVVLNTETDIGFGREESTPEENEEYFDKKWKLFCSFGIENRFGDGYFEGVFYI